MLLSKATFHCSSRHEHLCASQIGQLHSNCDHPPFGKRYSQPGAKIFNSPTFICFLKPLFKERKRGSFVSRNTLHAKRSTRCCNTWPFSIIVAGMKCYIQRRLSGVFSGSLPLMNKAHLYIFAVGLAFVSIQGNFLGTGCNLSSF